jgi:DASH complex subunit DAM1
MSSHEPAHIFRPLEIDESKRDSPCASIVYNLDLSQRVFHVHLSIQLHKFVPQLFRGSLIMSASKSPLDSSIKRSGSRSHRPTSRPTTPLRPSSRSSLREPGKSSIGGSSDAPLEAFEPAFAELADSLADLEANFMHVQFMHESLSRFSESFASFLYGLNMNAFCVDFPEVHHNTP